MLRKIMRPPIFEKYVRTFKVNEHVEVNDLVSRETKNILQSTGINFVLLIYKHQNINIIPYCKINKIQFLKQ